MPIFSTVDQSVERANNLSKFILGKVEGLRPTVHSTLKRNVACR